MPTDNEYGKFLPIKDSLKWDWTKRLTLSDEYQLDGTPLNGAKPLPDRHRMSLDGRWP